MTATGTEAQAQRQSRWRWEWERKGKGKGKGKGKKQSQHPSEQKQQRQDEPQNQSRLFVLRLLCLLLLTVQTSVLILLTRYSLRGARYVPASIVVMVEVSKMVFAACMELWTRPASKDHSLAAIGRDLVRDRRHFVKFALPAALYAIQNNLSYFALGRLSATSYQVFQQLKILTTALFAVLLMRKRLSARHWQSLLLLALGIALVQLGNLSDPSPSPASSWLGLLAILLNNLSSGFAGIYFERLVKDSAPALAKPDAPRVPASRQKSVWMHCMQLGVFGLAFSLLLAMLGQNGALIRQRGFFAGLDGIAWLVISMQAAGGILVALAVRYADSIVKAFATSASIVLSSAISFGLLDERITAQFVLGASMVMASVYLYATAEHPLHSKHSYKH